jgi:hypothetical protein
VVTSPLREAVVGVIKCLQPRLGFRQVEDETPLGPCALNKAGGALPVDRAEVDRLGASALFVGYLFKRLAGHARRGELVEVEPLLEGRRHCGVARSVRGGAQLHGAVVGDD